MVDDDIEAIIAKGEERTAEMQSKYEALNFEDLSNFKSEAMVRQWEGEDFHHKKKGVFFLEPAKRERKANYAIDTYYKEAMRAGPSKMEKQPKSMKPPKQVHMCVFFFGLEGRTCTRC